MSPAKEAAETSMRTARRRRRHFLRKVRNRAVAAVAPLIVRLWGKTLRVRFDGADRRQGHIPDIPNGIFLFWHQRIFALGGVFHHTDALAIVSQHGDGEMLAGVLLGLGIRPIRGSTTRGGTRALREVLRQKEDRKSGEKIFIIITPDGPRGPRHHLHPGAVYLASKTGLPLYLVAVSFGSRFQFGTWDGFLLPRPFTRTLFRLGDKIDVPADLERDDIEPLRADIEARLREVTRATDSDFEELYRNAKALRDLPEVPSRGSQ